MSEQTLTKNELVVAIAVNSGVTRPMVIRVLDALAETSLRHLAAGQAVRVPYLGTLALKQTKARSGHCAGRAWTKPAGQRVTFKATKTLKDALNAAS